MSEPLSQIQPFNYSRTFKAPRALVYEVHSKAEHIAKWFGPAGTKVGKFEMDFRVGGMNHYCIEIPGGIEMWGRQIYREIVPNEKIVHIQSFSDKDGGIGHHPMSPTWPLEMLAVTTFEDDGAGTKVTVSWLPYNADQEGINTFDVARGSMTGGFKGMFDTLQVYVENLA
ncbi:MAG: SRPBCC domain-containing protein [Pseudomonadota bacterium]